MTKVLAGITISLDGYITGPNDGVGCQKTSQPDATAGLVPMHHKSVRTR